MTIRTYINMQYKNVYRIYVSFLYCFYRNVEKPAGLTAILSLLDDALRSDP